MIRVGITSGWEPGTVVDGWPLVYVNKGLIDCLEEAGVIPVIIPVLENEQLIKDYMEFIDGIILAGEVLSVKRNVIKAFGTNILESSNPLRYRNEIATIQAAKKYKKPLLGICRGYQLLIVAEGGSVGDNDINIGNNILHQQGGIHPPETGVHKIKISEGSILENMLKADSLVVNSFHRQGVNEIPEGYRVGAVTEDNNIEAIESVENPFRMGIQFHPEMLKGEVWKNFFKEFINIIQKNETL